MKNAQLRAYLEKYRSLGSLKGEKVIYAIMKNRDKIIDHLKTFDKIVQPSDKYLEYEKKRIEICEACADKVNGTPMMKGNEYVITERTAFDTKMETLREEYKDVLEGYAKQVEEYEAKMEEEAKLNFHMVKAQHLHPDITLEQVELIKFMIDWD